MEGGVCGSGGPHRSFVESELTKITRFPVSQISMGVAGRRYRSPDTLVNLLSSDRRQHWDLHNCSRILETLTWSATRYDFSDT
jgi:hypothetical protein